MEPIANPRNAKALKTTHKSLNRIEQMKRNQDTSSTSIDSSADSLDLQRSPSGSIASHSFNSRNRLTTFRDSERANFKGAVAVKPTSVTEPTGSVQFSPTNVSFRLANCLILTNLYIVQIIYIKRILYEIKFMYNSSMLVPNFLDSGVSKK